MRSVVPVPPYATRNDDNNAGLVARKQPTQLGRFRTVPDLKPNVPFFCKKKEEKETMLRPFVNGISPRPSQDARLFYPVCSVLFKSQCAAQDDGQKKENEATNNRIPDHVTRVAHRA